MPAGAGTLTIYTRVDDADLKKGISGIAKSANRLASSMKFALGVAGFLELSKAAINAASDLQEYRNVAEVTFGDLIYKLDELTETSIEAYGMSRLTATQAASGFMAMGNAAGIAKEESAEMAIELTKYMADFASFYNLTHERARTALAAVYTGETETLKQYGIMLQEVNLQQFENEKGLGRSIKTMTAAEKAQLRYNYVMHVGRDAMGDFARTSDNWANQVRVLKENFNEFLIVVGNGLITMLTPVLRFLNTLIAAVIKFANTIGAALTRIFGINWQSMTDQLSSGADGAAESQDNLADSTKKAADAAKKALAPWDDLNVLQQENSDIDTNIGGGDYDTSGPSALDQVKDSIMSSIDSLYELGQYIRDVLMDVMDSIDWMAIFMKARKFGIGLADFLNGLLSYDGEGRTLFGQIAKTFANTLNTIIYSAIGFATTFDFTQLGNNIGDAVNQFFLTFDFTGLANSIDLWVQGLYDMVVAAIDTIEWSMVYDKAIEFLSELEVETVAIIIGAIAIKSIGKALLKFNLAKWIGTQLTTLLAGKSVSIGIDEIVATLSSGGLLSQKGVFAGLLNVFALVKGGAGTLSEAMVAVFGTTATVLSGVGSIVTGLFSAIWNFVSMLIDGFSWLKEILMVIGTALAAVGAVILGAPALIAAAVAAVVAAVMTLVVVIKDNWDAICSWFATAGEWFNTNVITPVVNFFRNMWTTISTFFANLWNDIVSIWTTVSTWFNDNIISPIVLFFEGFALRVSQIFEGLWIIIQAIWILVSEWFNTNIIIPITELFRVFAENVVLFFTNIWTRVKAIWTTVSSWFNTTVITPVKTHFSKFVTTISTFFSDLWKDIKTVWSEVCTWFSDNIITPLQAAWETMTTAISGFFSTLWSNIVSGVVGAMNAVIGAVEGAVNWIVNALNKVLEGFNKAAQWAAGIAGISFSGVTLIPQVSLGRLSVPKLANGAVIPPNKEFMAILGDQKHGTNIEAPLDTIKQAVAEVLGSQNVSNGPSSVELQIDGQTLGRLFLPYLMSELNRKGYNVSVLEG